MHQRAAYDVHGRPASLLLWGILARVSTSRRASSSSGLSLSLAFSRDQTPAGVGLGRARVVSRHRILFSLSRRNYRYDPLYLFAPVDALDMVCIISYPDWVHR